MTSCGSVRPWGTRVGHRPPDRLGPSDGCWWDRHRALPRAAGRDRAGLADGPDPPPGSPGPRGAVFVEPLRQVASGPACGLPVVHPHLLCRTTRPIPGRAVRSGLSPRPWPCPAPTTRSCGSPLMVSHTTAAPPAAATTTVHRVRGVQHHLGTAGRSDRRSPGSRHWRFIVNAHEQDATQAREDSYQEVSLRAVELLAKAQRAADEAVAEAQSYARDLEQSARDQYKQILERAQIAAQAARPGRGISERRWPAGSRRGDGSPRRPEAHVRPHLRTSGPRTAQVRTRGASTMSWTSSRPWPRATPVRRATRGTGPGNTGPAATAVRLRAGPVDPWSARPGRSQDTST